MKPQFAILVLAGLFFFSLPAMAAEKAPAAQAAPTPAPSAAPAAAPAPTGLLQLPDYRYPVYLFVPDNYEPKKDYALIVATPEENKSVEEAIQFWVSIARRKSMLVLMPTAILRPGSEPQRMDEWLMQIMSDVCTRYRIDKEKIFLGGVGPEAAHYASYLGINFPEKFSAVALLGGAWPGYLEQYMKFSTSIRKQPPFFVAFETGTNPEIIQQVRNKALSLEKKGYAIHLVELPQGEGFQDREFKAQLIDWMNEKSEHWYQALSTSKKTFKERFGEWLDRNIQVG